MNHVIKRMIDVDQSDIEQHNREATLLCNDHKNQELILYCSQCEELSCI